MLLRDAAALLLRFIDGYACFCFKKHTFHFCHIIGYIPDKEFLSRLRHIFSKIISNHSPAGSMKILPLHLSMYPYTNP